MTTLFSRWLPCLTLASWGAVLLYFYGSGRITHFLHPIFRPGVLIAGIVLALLALVFATVATNAECCQEAECSHPLSRFNWGKVVTFALLLFPIFLTAIFSPDSFSRDLVRNRGIITDASVLPAPPPRARSGDAAPAPLELPLPSKDGAPAIETPAAPTAAAPAAPAEAAPMNDYLTRTPEGNIVAEVLDLLYAAQDNTLRKDFEGKKVELIGQLMPDGTTNGGGNRFKAVRMFMNCCAADARPVATVVEAAAKPDLPEMTWIKIVGTATFPIENGRRSAVLKADRVEKAEPPAETMLF